MYFDRLFVSVFFFFLFCPWPLSSCRLSHGNYKMCSRLTVHQLASSETKRRCQNECASHSINNCFQHSFKMLSRDFLESNSWWLLYLLFKSPPSDVYCMDKMLWSLVFLYLAQVDALIAFIMAFLLHQHFWKISAPCSKAFVNILQ